MLDKRDLIAVRLAMLSDKNFIMSTWLRGLKYGNEWFKEIESSAYFKHYNPFIEKIISDPDAIIRVACLKDDPEVILGYSVSKGDRLDWIFVKKAWRAIGVAKSLLPSTVTTTSHLTTAGLAILKAKMPKVTFNPFI